MDPESSPGQEQQGAAPEGQTADQQTTQDVKPAESSTAEKGAEKPASAFEAVTAALKASADAEANAKTAEPAADSPTPKDGGPKVDHQQPDAGTDEDLADPDEKDLAKLSAKTRKSVGRLLKDRKDLRSRLSELEPDAVVTKNLREWGKANGVTSEDFQGAFSIMALAKTNPRKALELLEPFRANLMKQAGHELPEDLSSEVDLGTIPEGTAKELSILRADVKRREEQDRLNAERAAQERANSDVQRMGLSMAKAVQVAETRLKASDPDYERIQEFVKDQVEISLMRKPPASEKEAVDQFLEAVKVVKARAQGLLPQRRETTTVTGGAGSTNNRPAPKTALEAVNRALGV